MDLVEEAHGHEQQTRPNIRPVLEEEVQRRKLEKDLVYMLDLDLAVEDDPLVELVAEVENRPQEVGGVGLGGLVVYVVAVESLAVAADRKPPRELIDLGSRRTHAVAALELRLFGHCHVGARPLELLRQHLYRALKLSDAVFVEEIRIRDRSDFVRQRWRGKPDQRQCHQATCEFRHRDQPLRRAAFGARRLGSGFATAGLVVWKQNVIRSLRPGSPGPIAFAPGLLGGAGARSESACSAGT